MQKYFFKKAYLLFAYIIFVIVAPIINVDSSYKSAEMMDNATSGNYTAVFKLLIVVFIYFIAHGLLKYFSDIIRAVIIRNSRESLKNDMFKKLMETGNSAFSQLDVGAHIAAFSNDISILEYKYFEPWLQAIESILTIITAATAIFTLNLKLALVIILGETVSIMICFLAKKYSVNKNRIYFKNLALFTQRIKDYFAAFQTIRNYSVEGKINRKFSLLNKMTEDSKNEADEAITFVNMLAEICNSLIKFIVVGYGVVLMINGEITIGLIYAAYQFTNQIISPMYVLISDVNSIESTQSIIRRINKLLRTTETVENNIAVEFDDSCIVELEHIGVNVNNTNILNDVSYTFLPGKKYLIIGKNGAGKSTLLRLMKKSIDKYEGSIKISGVDLKCIPYNLLSKKVSYINESVSLLCDTVKQNIVLFRDIPDEELNKVVSLVGLRVPLDRVVRDGERNLSSGETRRIEIARSLINRAEVIIYDEAISTLDVQTAYSIEKTLLSLEEQTVIFVSHNFSSSLIRQYDEIILMENGRITDFGTHDELLLRNSYYKKIINIKNG